MKRYQQKEIAAKRNEEIRRGIEILEEANQEVSAKSLSKLTGFGLPLIYLYPGIRKYTKPIHRRNSGRRRPRNHVAPLAKQELNQTDESYMEFICEGYFSRPESATDVQNDMRLNISNFDFSTFHRAINKLLVQRKLKSLPLQPGKHVLETPEPRPEPAPVEPQGFDLKRVLEHMREGRTQQDGIQVVPKPSSVKREHPPIKLYQAHAQCPLSNGVFRFEFPSVLTEDDKETIAGFFQIVMKRRLQPEI